MTLHKTLIRPVMTYASPAWGHCAKSHIKQLQVLQNKILRIITKVPRIAPVTILHKDLKIHTIEQFIKKLTHNMYKRCENHHNEIIANLGQYDANIGTHKRPLSLFNRTIPISKHNDEEEVQDYLDRLMHN